MKNKKFLSLILALAMAFSLAVPAFASGTTATPIANTDVTDMGKIDTAVTTVNVGYQAPVLALTVPKTVAAMLNPYKLDLTLNKDTAIEEHVTDQVASAYNMIISRSSVPLTIKAKATGTIAGPTDKLMTLAKTNVAADSVKKEAYVWMQFGKVDTSAVNDVAGVEAFMKNVPGATDQPFTGITKDNIEWATAPGTYTDANTAVEGVIIAAGEGKEHLIDDTKYQLDQVTFDTTDPTKAATVSAVAFRLNGDMVPNPKDAPWGKEDKLTVSVAWKFVPGQQSVPADFDGTFTMNLDSANSGAAKANAELTAALAGQSSSVTAVTFSNVTGVTASNVSYASGKIVVDKSDSAFNTVGTVTITGKLTYTLATDNTTTTDKTFKLVVTVEDT